MLKCLRGSFFLASVSLFLIVSTAPAATDGKTIMSGKCIACHTTEKITKNKNQNKRFWNNTITRMKDYGLRISDDEFKALSTYLVENIK